MQTFTFYASDDKLENRGQTLTISVSIQPLCRILKVFFFCKLRVLLSFPQGAQINEAACDLAREVANEGDALVAGGVCQTPSYLSCKSETEVKAIFKKQMDVFLKKNVDFLIAEVNLTSVSVSAVASGAN